MSPQIHPEKARSIDRRRGRTALGIAICVAVATASCTGDGDDQTAPSTSTLQQPPQPPTSTPPPPTTTGPPSAVEEPTEPAGEARLSDGTLFMETFDGNRGLERFRYGVYHRDGGIEESGGPVTFTGDNNAAVAGDWTADHDLDCGTPDTQRPLTSDFEQDLTGDNDWQPSAEFHLDDLLYLCRDHLMTSMGEIAAYSIVWFSPDEVFDQVNAVEFEVNLTDLGPRQWWKVGVVTDALFTSTFDAGYFEVPARGHLVSDVDASSLPGLTGPDLLVASWSGGASGGHPGGLKIGDTKIGAEFDGGTDKRTRHPVSLSDDGAGSITFSVADVEASTDGAFPPCPCRVVFYDHNYTPDKDGAPIGHTWHWDNIIVS